MLENTAILKSELKRIISKVVVERQKIKNAQFVKIKQLFSQVEKKLKENTSNLKSVDQSQASLLKDFEEFKLNQQAQNARTLQAICNIKKVTDGLSVNFSQIKKSVGELKYRQEILCQNIQKDNISLKKIQEDLPQCYRALKDMCETQHQMKNAFNEILNENNTILEKLANIQGIIQSSKKEMAQNKELVDYYQRNIQAIDNQNNSMMAEKQKIDKSLESCQSEILEEQFALHETQKIQSKKQEGQVSNSQNTNKSSNKLSSNIQLCLNYVKLIQRELSVGQEVCEPSYNELLKKFEEFTELTKKFKIKIKI